MTQEVLKLALKELLIYQARVEGEWGKCRSNEEIEADGDTNPVITAIKEALAQPEQEPVVVVDRRLALRTWGFLAQECSPCAHEECQIEGKNFGVDTLCDAWNKTLDGTPTPPQRTWVGLTDDDLSLWDEDGVVLARYWEARLKQKNGYAEEKNT